ncbi:Fc.00g078190.m01.CDS01 [Cosmosporella sp. VM-42]
MKWSTILSASSLVGSVLSGPVKKRDEPLYRLRISTDFQDLNGKYLSTEANQVGVFSSGDKSAATKIYTNQHEADENTDTISLHTTPIGIVDHALGLVGSDGYLEFRDLTQPAVQSKAQDTKDTYSWDDFRLGRGGKENQLVWGKDKVKPGWIATPSDGDYTVKFFSNDGDSFTTQDYIPVKIILEPVEQ